MGLTSPVPLSTLSTGSKTTPLTPNSLKPPDRPSSEPPATRACAPPQVPRADFERREWRGYAYNAMTSMVNGVVGVGPGVSETWAFPSDPRSCAFDPRGAVLPPPRGGSCARMPPSPTPARSLFFYSALLPPPPPFSSFCPFSPSGRAGGGLCAIPARGELCLRRGRWSLRGVGVAAAAHLRLGRGPSPPLSRPPTPRLHSGRQTPARVGPCEGGGGGGGSSPKFVTRFPGFRLGEGGGGGGCGEGGNLPAALSAHRAGCGTGMSAGARRNSLLLLGASLSELR